LELNQAVLESRPGELLMRSLGAAGSPVAEHVLGGPATALDYTADFANIRYEFRQHGALMGASELAGVVGVRAAGWAGKIYCAPGGPAASVACDAAASGGAEAIVGWGQNYAAPWIGGHLYDLAPGLFTPSSNVTVPVTPVITTVPPRN
jgi:hypothetical protein